MRKLTTVLAGLLVLFTGCYYDKGDQVYPPVSASPAGCDTTGIVRYSVEVASIIAANCANCHSGSASAGAGYKLDTHGGLQIMANSGQLVRAITHTGPVYTHMPQGGNKLAACDIAKIRTWVRNGSLNN